jgi:hypothetical protein
MFGVEPPQVLLSSDNGDQLQLWDIGADKMLNALENAQERALGFFGGERFLVSAGSNGLVIREVPTLKITARLPLAINRSANWLPLSYSGLGGILCVGLLSTPDTVAVYYHGLITRFDLRTGAQIGAPLRIWRSPSDLERLTDSTSCAFSPDGSYLLIAVGNGIQWWGLDHGELLRTTDPGFGRIAEFHVDPDGRRLGIVNIFDRVQFWDAEGDVAISAPQTVADITRGISILGFLPRDRVVMHSSERVVVWDVKSGAAIADVRATGRTNAVSPRGVLYLAATNVSWFQLDADKWVARLCQVLAREATVAERRVMPPGSATDSPC